MREEGNSPNNQDRKKEIPQAPGNAKFVTQFNNYFHSTDSPLVDTQPRTLTNSRPESTSERGHHSDFAKAEATMTSPATFKATTEGSEEIATTKENDFVCKFDNEDFVKLLSAAEILRDAEKTTRTADQIKGMDCPSALETGTIDPLPDAIRKETFLLRLALAQHQDYEIFLRSLNKNMSSQSVIETLNSHIHRLVGAQTTVTNPGQTGCLQQWTKLETDIHLQTDTNAQLRMQLDRIRNTAEILGKEIGEVTNGPKTTLEAVKGTTEAMLRQNRVLEGQLAAIKKESSDIKRISETLRTDNKEADVILKQFYQNQDTLRNREIRSTWAEVVANLPEMTMALDVEYAELVRTSHSKMSLKANTIRENPLTAGLRNLEQMLQLHEVRKVEIKALEADAQSLESDIADANALCSVLKSLSMSFRNL